MGFAAIPPIVFEYIGIAGFALYVMNYALLTLRCLNGNCIVYFIVNLAASSFVLISLMNTFNLASAMIQVFWVLMSLIGIAMRLGGRRGPSHPA